MRDIAPLLADTMIARDRCLKQGVCRPLRLDRRGFLETVEGLARKNMRGAELLSAYARNVAEEPLSCLARLRSEARKEHCLAERMLDDTVLALGSMGGVAGLLGLLFSVETLNMGEEVAGDQVTGASNQVQRRMLEAIGICLDGFADDANAKDIILASAHHCLDLIATLGDHDRSIENGLSARPLGEWGAGSRRRD